jgi:acyl carrier protein
MPVIDTQTYKQGNSTAMDKMTIKHFITSNFLFTDNVSAVANDASLIRGGIVDSVGILELIEFLESTADIRISPQEMVPAHFDSIDSIAEFVESKLLVSTRAT